MTKKLTLTERILFGIIVGSATGLIIGSKYQGDPMGRIYAASGISAIISLGYSLNSKRNQEDITEESDYQI